MTEHEEDLYNLRPHLEHFVTTIFLIRDERRDGHAFSKLEAVFCDQYENYQEGIRAAMNVRAVVNLAVYLHAQVTRGRSK